jgi:RNA 2',3'-cyclic 3'-phosphodiesterase
MIRAFLAIRPTDEVIDRLTEVQSELAEGGGDVRWVSPQTMHLTIQFLGEVQESEVPEIERGLRQGLSTLSPFDIECRGLGVFPNQKRPRVVWVGLHGAGIGALAESTEIVLAPLGFPPQERELTPHITLGRVRSARGWDGLARLLKASGDRSFGLSRIDRITLYRSQLRPDGAVYTPLVTFSLAGE